MNISAKTEYACIAVLELASKFDSSEPVRIRDIAETHGVPPRFLVQILLQLKSAGIVKSVRGASGGYQLVIEPNKLSLGEVMSVIEGRDSRIVSNASRSTPVSECLMAVWNQVSSVEKASLEETTFGDLVRDVSQHSDNMYYI